MNMRSLFSPIAISILVFEAACTPGASDAGPEMDPAAKPRGAAPDAGPDREAARYRGYQAMNEIVRSRVVAKPTSFALSSYLDAPGADAGTGAQLAMLLGVWTGTGTSNEFRNGDPNPMNFLIWRTAFSALGREMASLCPGATGKRTNPNFEIRPELAPVVQRLCAWPQSSAREDTVLRSFWQGLTSYDAPAQEYEIWKSPFSGPTYANDTAETVIPIMVTAAFLDPYVILQR